VSVRSAAMATTLSDAFTLLCSALAASLDDLV
jgi:hypothetical protein